MVREVPIAPGLPGQSVAAEAAFAKNVNPAEAMSAVTKILLVIRRTLARLCGHDMNDLVAALAQILQETGKHGRRLRFRVMQENDAFTGAFETLGQ